MGSSFNVKSILSLSMPALSEVVIVRVVEVVVKLVALSKVAVPVSGSKTALVAV